MAKVLLPENVFSEIRRDYKELRDYRECWPKLIERLKKSESENEKLKLEKINLEGQISALNLIIESYYGTARKFSEPIIEQA